MTITLRNGDCLTYMKTVPDKYYDVCIADPPYGIGRDWEKRDWRSRAKFKDCQYMNVRPPKEFFTEMQRIAKNWIVWGWNYFTDILPPTNYLIVWDKMSNVNPVFKYSKCEIAGTSFKVPCNLVSCGWDGYRMGSETGTKKIHPHQKPVDLYRWLLDTYLGVPRGQKVFDPFAGSGALALACKEKGADYDGCEIEPLFFAATMTRIQEQCRFSRARAIFIDKDGKEIEWDQQPTTTTSVTSPIGPSAPSSTATP